MEKEIRLLRAEEIECRVATVSEKGVSLLLFKDARVDQRILDETFTPFGWRRTHQAIEGNLYCTVEIWDEKKKQWIAKQDVGTMSHTEKEKGQASDSFKRACFNWGIGRELYTAPFIWIPVGKVKLIKKGDRYTTNDRFCVKSIAYSEDREIVALEITDSSGQTVYAMKKESRKRVPGEAELELLTEELARTGVTMETVLKRYDLKDIHEMTAEVYNRAMAGLKKSGSRAA